MSLSHKWSVAKHIDKTDFIKSIVMLFSSLYPSLYIYSHLFRLLNKGFEFSYKRLSEWWMLLLYRKREPHAMTVLLLCFSMRWWWFSGGGDGVLEMLLWAYPVHYSATKFVSNGCKLFGCVKVKYCGGTHDLQLKLSLFQTNINTEKWFSHAATTVAWHNSARLCDDDVFINNGLWIHKMVEQMLSIAWYRAYHLVIN